MTMMNAHIHGNLVNQGNCGDPPMDKLLHLHQLTATKVSNYLKIMPFSADATVHNARDNCLNKEPNGQVLIVLRDTQ